MVLLGLGALREVLSEVESIDMSKCTGRVATYPRTALMLALLELGRWTEAQRVYDVLDRTALPTAALEFFELPALVVATRRGEPLSRPLAIEVPVPVQGPTDLRQEAFRVMIRAEHALWSDQPSTARAALELLVTDRYVAGALPSKTLYLFGLAAHGEGDLDAAERTAARLARRGPHAQELAHVVAGLACADAAEGGALARKGAEGLEARGAVWTSGQARMIAAQRLVQVDPIGARAEADAAWRHLAPLGAAPLLARLRRVYEHMGKRPPSTPRRGGGHAGLTEREIEVVRLVAQGQSNKQIARALFISPATVASHLKRMFRRLDIHSRTELTHWAARQEGVLFPYLGEGARQYPSRAEDRTP